MIIETFLAYIIMILPSLITILGGIATCALTINKIRKSSAEANKVAAEAKEVMDEVKGSKEVKELRALIKEEMAEKKALIKALTLAAEELRHIHEAHPEWLEEDNEQ